MPTQCPTCGTSSPDGARFCAGCGAGLPRDLTGQVLGAYRVLGPIGAGGMGQVFRAEHLRLGRAVAIKLLLSDGARDGSAIERFRREALVMASLHHPNVVSVLDFGDLEGVPYLVMEFIDGQTLREVLARRGALPLARAQAILRQVLSGLQESHAAGVVHRDLKPANVLVRALGEGNDHVHLVDFGIAKRLGRDVATEGLTQAGNVVGTPGYMAPEQIAGAPIDQRVDLYAAGVLLYEMLTGARLFGKLSDTARLRAHLAVEVPSVGLPLVDAFLRRALAKDPAQRFASAFEMRAAMPPDAPPTRPSRPRLPSPAGTPPVLTPVVVGPPTPVPALPVADGSLLAAWLRASPAEQAALRQRVEELVARSLASGLIDPLLELVDGLRVCRTPEAQAFEAVARQALSAQLPGLAALLEGGHSTEHERVVAFLGAGALRLLALLSSRTPESTRLAVARRGLAAAGVAGTVAVAERLPAAAIQAVLTAAAASAQGPAQTRPLLVLALAHPSTEARRAAIAALSTAQARAVDTELRKRLADKDVLVRVAAAGALGAIADLASVGPLATSVRSVTAAPVERAAAAGALGQIGGAQAARALREVLATEKDVQVRCAVVLALGEIGDGESLELLRREGSRLLAPRAVKDACERALAGHWAGEGARR